MKKFIKKNIKIILGFILGLIWSGGIVYAAANGYLFNSNEVSYDNTASGLESTNVQDALDELYANSDAYLAGLNAAHPIGSYLETSDINFNPNTSIGGTWTKETIKDDFIVDEGTSGIWTYRKWNSGIAECWGKAESSIVATQHLFSMELPFSFLEKPILTTSGGNSANIDSGTRHTDTTTTYVTTYTTGTWENVAWAYMDAIGKYKNSTASTIYRWHRTA